MSKKAVRLAVKEALHKVTSKEVEIQSRCIASALRPLLESHHDVACYMSMDQGEIDTSYLMEWLFEQGKKVYLPRCTSTTKTGQVPLRAVGASGGHPHLTFHSMDSWEKVKLLEPRGKYNLREPEAESPAPLPPRLDVMLVPGLAFDPSRGTRLGHGAGYYDDFFQRYQLQHKGEKPLLILTIGLWIVL
ncbi:5-formyltetrahydrofolate cyclo-ligase [Zygosaccharomyces rouxii]|nr:5-formyltetrahydrofolate cyclo-ligase [Zygosaccharomyces rouxii]